MLLLLDGSSNAQDAGAAAGLLIMVLLGCLLLKGLASAGGTVPRPRTSSSYGYTPRPAMSSSPAAVEARTVDLGAFPVARWLQKHGWTHDNGVYRGYFAARGHRIQGEVHYRAGDYELLLYSPPRWATKGSHSGCWRERTGLWRLLHLNESPPNVVAAILGCQAFLIKKLDENMP